MKLLFKILFFVLAIFQTNISEAKVFVFDVVVSERIPTVNEVKVKNYPMEISENDFGINCKSKNDFVDYSNLGLGAEAIAAKTGTTVLGKYPDYINLAEQLGAKRFNVPTNIWNKMSAAEQWGANQKFLDRMIMRGDKVILSNPVLDINKVSGAF